MQWYGISAPFLGGNQNIFSRQEGERLIKNDLLQLIFTAPGERVRRSGLGTPLRTFPFEQLDDTSLNDLKSSMMQAIMAYEQRVTVKQLNLVPNIDDHYLAIHLVVGLVDNPNQELVIDTKYIIPGAS
jgi:phage baseplate assembly protein W